MTVIDKIQQEVMKISHRERLEVLDFAKFLASKKAKDSNELPHLPNKFGSGKKYITYIADDFNEPLDDMKDYM